MYGRDAEAGAMTEGQEGFASFEQWLQQVGAMRHLSVEAIAAAMAEDGVDADESRWLAAATVLRHGGGALGNLLDDARSQEAALVFARHLRDARGSGAGNRPSISSRFQANTVRLVDGHAVSVRLRARAPEMVLLDDVLTEDECQALVAAARDSLKDSRVLGADAEKIDGTARFSSGSFVDASHGAIVAVVEARCAELLGWPLERCELIEVTRYQPGHYFAPHVDYFEPGAGYSAHESALAAGGQRIGTLILYLADVQAGGATSFEYAGIEFLPRRGSALYFGYVLPDGEMDRASLHQGMPVDQGEKWIATLWLREGVTRGVASAI